jgi:o-succinylbenzoate synthase
MKYRFQHRRYRLPFRSTVRTAHGRWSEREGVMVRLETETGAVGYGEASVIPWFGTETADEADAACRELSAAVDDERLASVPGRLVCLRNALTAARQDAGRAATPLAPGKEQREAAADEWRGTESAPYLGVATLLPAGRAALAEIAPKAEAGFRVFKWKVGVGDVADEMVLLDDVCAALPGGAKLRLDANGAWDRRQAARWMERCADRPVEFVEQPIAAEARGAQDGLLGLAGDYPTPIALDESLVGEGDVERWIGVGWRGIFVVKPALFGDVSSALARLKAAKAEVVFSSTLETAMGARAALEVAFAWTGKPRALGFGVWPLFVDARFDGPALAPFIRKEDVERMNPETVWNALT